LEETGRTITSTKRQLCRLLYITTSSFFKKIRPFCDELA